MAILGNGGTTTKGDSAIALNTGRTFLSPATLASAGVLNELHGWFNGTAANIRVVIYADTSGAPGALVAYTSPIALPGTGDVHLSQSGFSVPLGAGTYWLGFVADGAGTGTTQFFYNSTGGSYAGLASGASFTPPNNPFGTPTNTDPNRLVSCWAVLGAIATPVADFTGTPTSGTTPLSVAFTDTSTNSPTSWAWTFGDGGTSTSQNPTHSYTTAGTYTVALVATNAGGSNTKTRTGYVTTVNPSGVALKIKFGDHLKVTDEGGGVIRVDYF